MYHGKIICFLFLFYVSLLGCGKRGEDTEAAEQRASDIRIRYSLNSQGEGILAFLNQGEASGSVCGIILVTSKADGRSSRSTVQCSGELEPSFSAEFKFFVANIDSVCGSGPDPWNERCDVTFTRNYADTY